MGALVPDVFHIALAADWEGAQGNGSYTTSTRGLTLEQQGFIHLSFVWQVEGVLRRFFAHCPDPLVLLRIDSAGLDLVIEPIPSGEHFAHLYGPLPVTAVTAVLPFPGEMPQDLWPTLSVDQNGSA